MILEEKILNYLQEKLSAEVFLERPAKNIPKSYVIIERVGGMEKNLISQATIAIKSIAPTLFRAASLDHDVVTAMRDFAAVTNVSSCSLNADTNFTDTTTKEYRYQSTYIITYMED